MNWNKYKIFIIVLFVLSSTLTIIEIKKKNVARKELFEVHSSRLNCPTVSLIVYDDKTYQYIYTYGIEGHKEKSRMGTYTYNVSKILETLDYYPMPEKTIGPWIITTNGKSYELYENHIELQEFLESISIHLDKCLESPI